MTTQLRVLAGATALVAGLWFLTDAGAAPTLPKDTYKKVIEADIGTLQKYIEICDSDPKEAKRHGPTVRSLSMMLAAYAEATGDAALRDEALNIAKLLSTKEKDWKKAGEMAAKLKAKPGAMPLKPSNVHAMHKFALDEVMSPFRGGTVGGMNIEKDIRALRDKKGADPAAVELLAARTAIISDFAVHFPNDKAMVDKKKTDQWIKLSKDATELSQKLAEEAAKGKKASEAEIYRLAGLLDAKCVNCHKDFRDD